LLVDASKQPTQRHPILVPEGQKQPTGTMTGQIRGVQ